MGEYYLWGMFAISMLVMLVYDIGFYQSRHTSMTFKQAAQWSIGWITVALVFGVAMWVVRGTDIFVKYLTAYVVEKSLSLDNIFVFVMLFKSFKLPIVKQRRILSWGVIGAVIMRVIMIVLGVTLINKFHWIIYVFGGFLIYTAFKFWKHEEAGKDPRQSLPYKLIMRYLPVNDDIKTTKFWVKESFKGRTIWVATPAFVVLVMVEFTDLIFAIDSIPAVLAITSDMMVVITSNIYAIMGLRALYFLMANAIESFYYLNQGLAALLLFVGTKMLLVDVTKIPTLVSLSVILGILTISVMASLIKASREIKT